MNQRINDLSTTRAPRTGRDTDFSRPTLLPHRGGHELRTEVRSSIFQIKKVLMEI